MSISKKIGDLQLYLQIFGDSPNSGDFCNICLMSHVSLSDDLFSGHYFLKVLDRKGKLSKYFTQNIDGLERLAGLSESKIVEAHGTFAHAKCIRCEEKVNMEEFREKIRCDQDPTCRNCGGWVKPSIVFFGEALPPRFFDEAEIDCEFCDQLICIGTSLEVYPFAGM